MNAIDWEKKIIEDRLKVIIRFQELYERDASFREYEEVVSDDRYAHVVTLEEFLESLKILKTCAERLSGAGAQY